MVGDHGDHGGDVTQHIADIFRNSMVKFVFSLPLSFLSPLLLQTLTSVNLNWSKIGDDGIKTLSDAIQNHTVTTSLSLIVSFASSYPHTDTN